MRTQQISRYHEHQQDLAVRGGIESWIQYIDVSKDSGRKLLQQKNDFEAQLETIKQISREDFISVVIENYQGDSSYQYHFRRLITAVVEASGASLEGEELTAHQTTHTVTVHDGRTVKKRTVTRREGKKVRNHEAWTKSQKTFIAVRVQQGKSREQIYKEYNYSKSFRYARTKESINSEIDRQK